ncbi:SH3 domain-containing protein [bacterium]|nr:SH3 domain-containing protein [bacterium]
MKRLRWSAAAIMAAALWATAPGPVAADEIVYAKTYETELREGTGLAGPVVVTVEQGTALTVLKKTRMRYLVRTPSGEKGWVSKLKISEDPPDADRGFGGLIRGTDGPEEMRTAASGRGLSENAENLAGGNGGLVDMAVINAVQQMEERAADITETEVDEFLREGGINS